MTLGFDLAQVKNPVFLETGTWKGECIHLALKNDYEKIISIELVPRIFQRNQLRFEPWIQSGLVHLLHGNSADVMPEAMKLTGGLPTTFWLDAHYQGRGKRLANPLFRELDAIAEMPNPGHIIMIDDRRLFKKWGVDEEKLRARLLEVHLGCELSHERGFVPDDILVARRLPEAA